MTETDRTTVTETDHSTRRTMIPRRTALAACIAALSAPITGCAGFGGSDEEDTPDPDEGPDSYGVHLFNRSDTEQTVGLLVEQPWEDEIVFEKTVHVDGGDSRTWNGVIVDEGVEHAVAASVEVDDEDDDPSSSTWVTPGENAPPDTNVTVRVSEVTTQDGPRPAVAVYFESRQ